MRGRDGRPTFDAAGNVDPYDVAALCTHPAPARGVLGFDYAAKASVRRTPAEWRQAFPASRFDRRTGLAPGETWYFLKGGKLAAEVYAIIPEGTPSP